MNVHWRNLDSIVVQEKARSVTSGEEANEEEQIHHSSNSIFSLLEDGKPLLIWAYDAEDKTQLKKIEDMFAVEKMALSCKLFTCIKVPMSGMGMTTNTVSFYGIEGDFLGSVVGKISQNKVFGLMNGVAKRSYKTPSLSQFTSNFTKLLNEIDRLSGQQKTLQDKKTRLEEKGKTGEIAKVEAEMKQIEEQLARLDETEKELLKFELNKAKS